VRVLYLHQFFLTRADGGGTRSYELARHLVAAGHEVVMLTAGDGDSARRDVEGIRVIEVRGAYADYARATGMGYGGRAAAFGRFAAGAAVAALRAQRPDVVFASSPPLTIALPAIAAARRHRAPFVFEVRDLWPRAPIEMGALESPWAQRGAYALESWVLRQAEHVVALSPGMVDGVVMAGADPERVTLVPNASDLDLFRPDLDPGDLRERHGLGDRLVVSYFGTMGEANDLSQAIEAAALLSDENVAFVLQGEGKRRPAIEAEVRRRGLSNVILLPAGDKASAARLAAASDACMTLFKDVPVLATNSPNKLFDTFAAGRPAIVNTGGWQRDLVEENAAGVFVRPGDAGHLAAEVLKLRDDPDLRAGLGRGARALAEARFDRRLLVGRVREILERAAGA